MKRFDWKGFGKLGALLIFCCLLFLLICIWVSKHID